MESLEQVQNVETYCTAGCPPTHWQIKVVERAFNVNMSVGADTMYETFVDNPRMTRIRERTVWIHADVPGQGYSVPDLPSEYVIDSSIYQAIRGCPLGRITRLARLSDRLFRTGSLLKDKRDRKTSRPMFILKGQSQVHRTSRSSRNGESNTVRLRRRLQVRLLGLVCCQRLRCPALDHCQRLRRSARPHIMSALGADTSFLVTWDRHRDLGWSQCSTVTDDVTWPPKGKVVTPKSFVAHCNHASI